MLIYPSKSGFDSWEKLGNPGWGWDSMAPYFRKFHTFTAPEREEVREDLMLDYMVKDAQGDSGPVQVSFGAGDGFPPFSRAWPRAFKALNQELTGDPISGIASGAFSNPATIDPVTRQRSHAASAYYPDHVAQRPNLRVLTEALVEKVLLERQADGTVSANGVQFTAKDGKQRQIVVKREVILAAGALKTPQLLELSGIGSKELLTSHGIECLVDNPNVGENLQDHGFVPFSWEVADPLTSGDQLRDPQVQIAAMAAYQSAAAGPLAICPISSSFLPLLHEELSPTPLSSLLSHHLDRDLDSSSSTTLAPGLRAQYTLLRSQLLAPDDTSGQYTLAPFQLTPNLNSDPSPAATFSMSVPGFYASIVAVLNHPFSRGAVHVRSPSPADAPTLDTRTLSHPLDLELHARHALLLERLRATPPLAPLFKPAGRRLHNGGAPVETLDQAREAVRSSFSPHFHVCGTAAMMARELGGVVDARLRVWGCEGLRVVDASVFPLIPRGNIQADVYAVAERAAGLLVEDWTESGRV